MNQYTKQDGDISYISYVQFIDNAGNPFHCKQFPSVNTKEWTLNTIQFKNKTVEYINMI